VSSVVISCAFGSDPYSKLTLRSFAGIWALTWTTIRTLPAGTTK
jgi:hypothetical protein